MSAFLVSERGKVRHAGKLAVYGVNSSQEDPDTTEMGSCLLVERTVLDGLRDTAGEEAVMEVGQLGPQDTSATVLGEVMWTEIKFPRLWRNVGRPYSATKC